MQDPARAKIRWHFSLLLLGAGLAGCAAHSSAQIAAAQRKGEVGRALELYSRAPARDPEDLVRIAETLLEREAADSDPKTRARGFAAIAAAGAAARGVLERLSQSQFSPVVRGRALALRARMGERAAARALAPSLASDDAELRAAAVEALDPRADVAQLLILLESPSAAVRAAALGKLRAAPEDGQTGLALSRSARHDPDRDVRLAALRALGAQGPSAVSAIEPRLDDENPSVRLAAVAALAQATHGTATAPHPRLLRLLREEPRAESIEAARLLASVEPEAARELFGRGLRAPDNAVRAQTAVALSALPAATARALAAPLAAHEGVRSIRLWLALALGRELAAGRELLEALGRDGDVVAAESQAELARGGDARAQAALVELLKSPTPAVRATAARVLARELERADEVRALLADEDPGVRLAAASAVLAGNRNAPRPPS